MSFIARIPVTPTVGTYRLHQEIFSAAGADAIYARVGNYALVVAPERPKADEIKPYNPKIATGEVLRFDLFASVERRKEQKGYDPVAKLHFEQGTPWKEAARTVAAQWLQQKGEPHGFAVQELAEATYEPVTCVRKKDRAAIRHAAIRMSGILKVTDEAKFRSALLKGVGRGKAWGLGLVLVRRLKRPS